MKKDIYIIKNSINDKVYIGQAKDAAERWLAHVYNARYENRGTFKGNSQIIHRAMMKYGIENFHYEILEYQIENYDEREIYWIKQYNSIAPNGYNVSPGGRGTGCGGDRPSAVFKTKDALMGCISEISSGNKTFVNIAKKYNCSPEVISAINSGKRYRIDGMRYPLRDSGAKYSNELIRQIRYSLKHERDLTLKQIAEKYKVALSQVSEINNGKIYYVKSDSYPLREKRTGDIEECQIDGIIEDILYSDLCLADIAGKYELSRGIITNINHGNFHRRENLTYPLREENDSRNRSSKKFLDIDEVRSICELLKGDLPVREIAEKNGVSATTIQNINNGACKKYKIDGYKYPIRKFH